MSRIFPTTLAALASVSLAACGGDDDHHHHDHDADLIDAAPDASGDLALTLFVAYDGKLAAFDVATGVKRDGEVADVTSPVDMQTLASGHVVVNLTDRNELLIVDGHDLTSVTRAPSSTIGGTRPVHLYLSPRIDDRQYLVVNNDGVADTPATNSSRFFDITPGSATYLEPAGEVPLGLGHHKLAFSTDVARVSISNINDCETIVEVFDYADPSNITSVGRLTGAAAGVGQPGRPCDQTGRPSPHGGAAAWAHGRAFHNLTGWGMIAAIDQDATPVTFAILPTAGNGAGYSKAHKQGRYVYSLQRTPREGDATRPGATCQIGQLVVLDGMTGQVAAEVPIKYGAADCATAITGTLAERAGPGHILVSPDGTRLYVTTTATPPMDGEAETTLELVFDVSSPAAPAQLAPITVGRASGGRNHTLSGDGRYLLVANNVEETVTVYDLQAGASLVRTIPVGPGIRQVATFGTAEGPGPQQGPP